MTKRFAVALLSAFVLLAWRGQSYAAPDAGVPSATPTAAPHGSASAAPTTAASASATPASASAAPSAAAPPSATAEEPKPPPPPPPPPTASASSAPLAPPSAEPEPAPSPTATPAPAPSAEPATHPSEAPAEVKIGETVAFVVRTHLADLSPEARAQGAMKAIKEAFDAASPEDVHVEHANELAVVYLGKTPVIQLGAADAKAAGDASLDVHADAVASQLAKAVRAEKSRSALASKIFSICLVVFFGVVVLYLWRKIAEFASRASDWLETNPQRIPAIRVRSLQILTPGAVRTGVALAISFGKWIGQFAIVYLWLLFGLSLFETTRDLSEQLNGYILSPFVALAARVASSLPIVVVVAIAVLAVAIVFRVVGLFFEGVREGSTTIEWLPPELARPTATLVRIGLVLVTLVVAAPVLTGHPDGALARAGQIGLVTLGLASVPLTASAVVGMVVVYGRRFRIGEYISVGRF
ncbi:MAG TPA: hypothetical protein VL400_08795, partial [Polyangiaceae bacterium]|nr:hypothetical protein [Polyangiaceae bacterium]